MMMETRKLDRGMPKEDQMGLCQRRLRVFACPMRTLRIRVKGY